MNIDHRVNLFFPCRQLSSSVDLQSSFDLLPPTTGRHQIKLPPSFHSQYSPPWNKEKLGTFHEEFCFLRVSITRGPGKTHLHSSLKMGFAWSDNFDCFDFHLCFHQPDNKDIYDINWKNDRGNSGGTLRQKFNLFDIYLSTRKSEDIPKISQRYPKNIPKISPRYP